MAMSKRSGGEKQEDIWIAHTELAVAPGHPFYRRLSELLEGAGFDEFVEGLCARFYHARLGRPSLQPGVYFRALLVGYFEGIDSERGIAWRVADSLALRRFLLIGLDERTPDHSTISRTRRLIDIDTHREVFSWVLGLLAERGLLKGRRMGIDATTLEANAAMRSIVRRDTGETYEEFLRGLAKASGIETPTREDLARLDRKRKKRTSNKEWRSPADGDARIAKMKDGRTHLAHKAEHAVDMDTGAIVAVTLQAADEGDTTTLDETLCEAGEQVAEQMRREAELRPQDKPKIHLQGIEELVTDKGYHSGAVVQRVKSYEVRSYIPEKKQKGRRDWHDKRAEQQAVYANRRRVRGEYGKSLLRRRGELIERSFAHCYETGGMRRCHLRGRENILKRQLVHVGAFNLSLILRKLLGAGTPRELKNRAGQVFSRLLRFLLCWMRACLSTRRLTSAAGHGWHHLCVAAHLVTAPAFFAVLPRTARPEPKKVDAKEAAIVVAGELETDVSKLKYSCEETWLPVEDELRPCFHVKATCFDPFGDWYGFVSFEGELLALFNVASAVSATTQGYKINPTRTPNLEALQLNLLGAPSVLSGSRTIIWGPNQTQARGDKGTFHFPPTSEEFDEPQLYYFLEFCRDQAAVIGKNFLTQLFAGTGFNPMNGTVHYDGALDNAYYSANNGQLYFGDSSDGQTYSSRSLDIVLHEFGHAISDAICRLGRARVNDQSRAMSEGYSDYFAATILGNPIIGDDFMPSYARSCANTSKFPKGFAGEEHAVGTVWAGLMWDLRNEPTIGQSGADLIILQSLTYLGPWKTILQGLEALVQADRVVFPGPDGKHGAHEDKIRAVFKARQR